MLRYYYLLQEETISISPSLLQDETPPLPCKSPAVISPSLLQIASIVYYLLQEDTRRNPPPPSTLHQDEITPTVYYYLLQEETRNPPTLLQDKINPTVYYYLLQEVTSIIQDEIKNMQLMTNFNHTVLESWNGNEFGFRTTISTL